MKKVGRASAKKAFEQAAGFLRIREGAHPLDTSAVHPESYDLVDRMAKDLNCSVAADSPAAMPPCARKSNSPKYVTRDRWPADPE